MDDSFRRKIKGVKMKKKHLRGRCAITGRFITLKEAKRRKKTAVIERY